MALSYPVLRGHTFEHNAGNGRPATTTGTTITGGAAHTLSASFTELFSSTTYDAHWVTIILHDTFGTNTRTDILVNIYTGAASSEQVLIPNLLAGWSQVIGSDTIGGPKVYHFPLYIPAGTRITAKSQGVIASDTVEVIMELQGGYAPWCWTGRRVECLGADTASSIGTSVTPGTASEGTFTAIGTSTYAYGYVYAMVQGGMSDTAIANAWLDFDIGVGGSLLTDLSHFNFAQQTTETVCPVECMGRFCKIPAGTALQLRGQTSAGTAEALDACIYGVY